MLPLVIVMLDAANTVPAKKEPLRVASLPTCQKTLQAWAPPIKAMVLLEPTLSAVPAWKRKIAFGSPPPSRVTVPETPIVVADL
jgi:hypothetical protein